jgi:ankyrin repeat protein
MVVWVLLDVKADIDAKNSERRPPLHWATGNWHEVVVRLLLEHQVDVDVKTM